MRRALTLALVGAVLAGCASSPAPKPEPAFERVTFTLVPSGSHGVPVSIYRPDAATGDNPVPVVLHSHGWGGSRETRLGAFGAFTDAGLGVVSIDMRGHGEARATSEARMAHPDHEIADVRAVLTYVAALDWVLKESPGDPVAGAMGESYGGAFPLVTAAVDGRLDAVFAKDTWHDLAQAMAPNGVPKGTYFATLWLSASVTGRLHPEVRSAFEAAVRTGQLPDGEGGGPDLVGLFRESSASAYEGGIRVPTFILQGVNDTLFDLGQGLANQAAIDATGAPTAFVTHLGGHTLGRRGGERDPCGEPEDLALEWFRRQLLEGPQAGPVCIVLDDATVLRPDAIPSPARRSLEPASVTVQPGNVSSRGHAELAIAGPVVLWGSGRVTGHSSGNGTVFVSVEAVRGGAAVKANQQAYAIRLAPGPFEADLPPLAFNVREGDALRLVFAASDPAYASDAAPRAVVELSDLLVELGFLAV